MDEESPRPEAEPARAIEIRIKKVEEGHSYHSGLLETHKADTAHQFQHINTRILRQESFLDDRAEKHFKWLQFLMSVVGGVLIVSLATVAGFWANARSASTDAVNEANRFKQEMAGFRAETERLKEQTQKNADTAASVEKLMLFYRKSVPDLILAQQYYTCGKRQEVLQIVNTLLSGIKYMKTDEEPKEYVLALLELKAQVCLDLQEIEQAADAARQLIKMEDEEPIGHYYLGWVHFEDAMKDPPPSSKTAELQEAYREFETALGKDTDKNNWQSLTMKLWCLVSMKDFKAARTEVKNARTKQIYNRKEIQDVLNRILDVIDSEAPVADSPEPRVAIQSQIRPGDDQSIHDRVKNTLRSRD